MNYQLLEQGFIKEAVDQGYDADFLKGFLKEAQDLMDHYANCIALAEKNSNDQDYRVKLANELLYASPFIKIEKSADGTGIQGFLNNPQIHQGLEGLGKTLSSPFGGGGGAGLGGGVVGGGGGALIGLLLARLLGLDPSVGLMLGATGGGALGTLFGKGTLGDLFKSQAQSPSGAAPAQTPAQTPPETGQLAIDPNNLTASGNDSISAALRNTGTPTTGLPPAQPQFPVGVSPMPSGQFPSNSPAGFNVPQPDQPAPPLVSAPPLPPSFGNVPTPSISNPQIPGAAGNYYTTPTVNKNAPPVNPMLPKPNQLPTVAKPSVPSKDFNPQPLLPSIGHQSQMASQVKKNAPPVSVPGSLPSQTLGMSGPSAAPTAPMKPGATSLNPTGKTIPQPSSPYFPKS